MADLRRPLLCKWAVQPLEPFPIRCVRPSISVAMCVPQDSRSAISGPISPRIWPLQHHLLLECGNADHMMEVACFVTSLGELHEQRDHLVMIPEIGLSLTHKACLLAACGWKSRFPLFYREKLL